MLKRELPNDLEDRLSPEHEFIPVVNAQYPNALVHVYRELTSSIVELTYRPGLSLQRHSVATIRSSLSPPNTSSDPDLLVV